MRLFRRPQYPALDQLAREALRSMAAARALREAVARVRREIENDLTSGPVLENPSADTIRGALVSQDERLQLELQMLSNLALLARRLQIVFEMGEIITTRRGR